MLSAAVSFRGLFYASHGLDGDRFLRYVLISRAAAGFHGRDRIDDFHSRGDPSEHGIAEIARAVIQEVVVDDV